MKAAAKLKKAAKAAKKEAQQAHIKHVAEYESRAKDNKILVDATPHDTGSQVPVPNIGPDNSGGPPDESGGFVRLAEETTLAPKERKKPTSATKATKAKQLPTIAENSNNESVPLVSKKAPMLLQPFVILEETDSDGFGPPRGILKLKAR